MISKYDQSTRASVHSQFAFPLVGGLQLSPSSDWHQKAEGQREVVASVHVMKETDHCDIPGLALKMTSCNRLDLFCIANCVREKVAHGGKVGF